MRDDARSALLLTALFSVANLLGVAAGVRLYASTAVQQAAAAYQSPASGAAIFAILVASTAILLALYRWNKAALVKVWFGSALVFTGFVLFDAFLPVTAAAAATLVFAVLRFRTDDLLLRNVLDTVPFAGAGALFGAVLGVQAVLVFAALLAVYDYIAVNRLGHMVTLAKEGAASDTLMGFQYPKSGDVSDAAVSDLSTGTETGREGQRIGMLGGGDVVMPIVIAVSLIPLFGVGAAVSVVAGSAAALFVFLTVIQARESEQFYPAIPVVGSGAVLGLTLFLALSAL
ncbi:MAG: presenilin family intramembrane aspartyl protease [Candidatus Nanohaloarchaea archaeon]|nr:presenilin family intramembrane aspartyl protease [Candidatus Nanohaloarchaea archaeon]